MILMQPSNLNSLGGWALLCGMVVHWVRTNSRRGCRLLMLDTGFFVDLNSSKTSPSTTLGPAYQGDGTSSNPVLAVSASRAAGGRPLRHQA